MKILSLTFLVFLSIASFAQQTIKVLDNETGQPVPGVLVEILDTNAKQVTGSITDLDGFARFELAGNYKVKISHVSYDDVTSELKPGEQVIRISSATTTLGDVVVTGQYHPQSAENSVYAVRSIDNETIQKQGAIQLADVLSKEMNIRLDPDMATGETNFRIQGMKNANVKILVDGIPLVGRDGNGNNADVSQINISTIERIEIVEGPMAVNYGANALGGVINLITKSGSPGTMQIGASAQVETVDGKLGSNDGKYTGNVNGKFWINPKLYTGVNLGTTLFKGFQGDKSGRELQWNPKDQYLADARLGYKSDKFHIYYKMDYLWEQIYDKGPINQSATEVFAFDETFTTNRFVHQIQTNGSFYDGNSYSIIISYSDNSRIKRLFKKDLISGEKTNVISEGAQDTTRYSVFLTRGSYNVVDVYSWLDFEVGYDINLESTSGGRLAGETQSIQDYALFASAEAKAGEMLKIRPGIRYAYNSRFASPVVPSVNIKYSPSPRFDLRAAYGRGYRAPSLRELYMEFVDVTHRVFGNENLTPESSHHFDAGMVFKFNRPMVNIRSELSGFYNNVTDLIDFSFSALDPGFAKYTNIGEFRSIGFNIKERLAWKTLEIGAGFGYTGIYQNVDTVSAVPEEYLFSPEVTVDATYQIPKTGVSLSTYYKYTGSTSEYRTTFDENDNETFELFTVSDYSIWDITVSRNIGNYLRLSIGGKNLLNTRNLTSSVGTPGGVHTNNGNRPISYGRSIFVKLDFNLNK